MKIESIIKRKKGTIVKMEDPRVTYHFKPEGGIFDNPHVATVEDEGHARLFLRVDEAYRLFEGEAPAPLPDQEVEQPLGASILTAGSYKITGGETVEATVLVNMAFDDSEMDIEDWNALSDDERGVRISAVLNELQADVADDALVAEKQPEATKEPVNQEPVAQEGVGLPEKVTAIDPDDFGRDELVEMFQKRFGRQPSRQMKKEDIARALSADDE